MEQGPSWEANRFLGSQEIPRISRNPNFHYHIQKWPPPVPILSQLDPVHTSISHFLKIHLNIILPCTPGSPKWSHSLRFPHQTLYTPPLSPIRATCPSPLILLYFITRKILGEEYRPLRSSLCPSRPLRYIILYSHPCPRLPNGLFPSCFPDNTLYTVLLPLMRTTCPARISFLDLNSQHWMSVSNAVLRCAIFSNLPLLPPFRCKYLPQSPLLEHPQRLFWPQYVIKDIHAAIKHQATL